MNYHPNVWAPRDVRVKITPRSGPNKNKPFTVRSKKGAKAEEGVSQTVLKALGMTPLAINVGAAEPTWELPLADPAEGWRLGEWLVGSSRLNRYDTYFDLEYILSKPGKTSVKFELVKCKAEKGLGSLDAGETEIANTISGKCCDIKINGRSVFGDQENRR